VEAVTAKRAKVVQAAGIAVTVLYAAFVVWLYVAQPRSIEELKTAAAVQTNVYSVDPAQFDLAVTAFRERQYRIAIDHFLLADPAARDPKTQFLVAYAHYALGRGRLYDDDEEFKAALAAVDRCLEAAPGHAYTIDEPALGLDYTSAERLRERLRAGLEVTPGDFNPFGGSAEKAP
jgi:tetratricopeptide (TPR) repeat protein